MLYQQGFINTSGYGYVVKAACPGPYPYRAYSSGTLRPRIMRSSSGLRGGDG